MPRSCLYPLGDDSLTVVSTVVLFTALLFFSGYAIQQRTLRDLRIAIKPSPRASPKIFLPDRFQRSTTELEDGTIVAVEDGYDRRTRSRRPAVVEVRPTVSEDSDDSASSDEEEQQQQQEEEEVLDAKDEAPTRTDAQRQPEIPQEQVGAEKPQKPMSRAERRRRIKEEIQKLAQGEERGYYQRRLW
jgi:hypothetical protein